MEKSIITYFKDAMNRYSDLPALTDSKGSYTYNKLEERSNTVAYYIVSSKITVGSVVAISMERSKDCIVAMLGVLKAGCTYMFIDISYPEDRKQFMLEDSDACILIDDKRYRNIFESNFSDSDNVFNPAKLPIIHQQLGAYIIYTSGSTGKPKGLLINHFNVIELYNKWAKEFISLPNRENINTGVIAPFGFDMCVLMIYASLFKGHNLHIISEDEKQNGEKIVMYLNNFRIDLIDATPNYLRLIANHLKCHRGLRLHTSIIFCIGDVLSYNLAEEVIDLIDKDNFILYNSYGPAECTVLVTYYELNKRNIKKMKSIPIGINTSNSILRVMDGEKFLSVGEVGEMVIFGDCVGMGYISKREIKPNPFDSIPNGPHPKSYRTGDLVKQDENGVFEFVGRVDRQCKINGYRVEIEEIEHAIEKISNIKEARVITKKDENDFTRLYAFYVGEIEYNINEIKKRLREELPYYMIPQEIRYCKEFPINQNGKIDYHLLLHHIKNNQELSIEDFISQLLEKLIGYNGIDKRKSFYALGGDSITMLAFISDILTRYDIDLDISKVYASETIEEIIHYLKSLNPQLKSSMTPVTNSSPVEIEYPIIESQKKLFDLERKAINSQKSKSELLGYSLIYRIKFKEEPDIDRLEQCINTIMSINETFRVRFIRKRNRCFCILKETPQSLKIKQTQEGELVNQISYLDLFGDELVEVVKVNDKEIILNVKHILLDFISVQYFLSDVFSLYGNDKGKERLGFISYLSKNNFLEEKTIHFWKGQLDKSPLRTKLPAATSTNKDISFELYHYNCSKDMYSNLMKISKQNNISLFIALLSVFVKVIRLYTNADTMRIGCYLPGRNQLIDNGVLGMFTNVLPLIFTWEDGAILKTIQKEVQNMLMHQNISQSCLYQLLPMEELEDGEIFDICFNYQNNWSCLEKYPELIEEINSSNFNPDITNRSFYFGVIEENRKIQFEIKYNAALYDTRFIDDFVERLEEEVNGYVW